MFESLPELDASSLEVMKHDPPTKAFLKLDKREQFMKSRAYPRTLASLLWFLRQASSSYAIVVAFVSLFRAQVV